MRTSKVILSCLCVLCALCGRIFWFATPGLSGEKGESLPSTRVRKGDPDAFKLLLEGKLRYEREVEDYRVTFYRQECLAPERNSRMEKPETILMKFREKPFSADMRWVDGEKKGSRALYVQGTNKNRVRVHPSGIAGIFVWMIDLDPNSKQIVGKHSRKPITMAGIGYLMKSLLDQFHSAIANRDLKVNYIGIESVGGRPAYKFQRLLPPDKGYYCYELLLWIDKEWAFPVQVETKGWDGVIWEKYRYENFEFNNGFTDKDFKW